LQPLVFFLSLSHSPLSSPYSPHAPFLPEVFLPKHFHWSVFSVFFVLFFLPERHLTETKSPKPNN
jgi:hypothetical protein